MGKLFDLLCCMNRDAVDYDEAYFARLASGEHKEKCFADLPKEEPKHYILLSFSTNYVESSMLLQYMDEIASISLTPEELSIAHTPFISLPTPSTKPNKLPLPTTFQSHFKIPQNSVYDSISLHTLTRATSTSLNGYRTYLGSSSPSHTSPERLIVKICEWSPNPADGRQTLLREKGIYDHVADKEEEGWGRVMVPAFNGVFVGEVREGGESLLAIVLEDKGVALNEWPEDWSERTKIISTLHTLHSISILHGQIKPSSFRKDEDGEYWIENFSRARIVDQLSEVESKDLLKKEMEILLKWE